MSKKHSLLVAVVGIFCSVLGCEESSQPRCPAHDGGVLDSGVGPEARPCRSDDPYALGLSAHMSIERFIVIRSLDISRGNSAQYDSGALTSRLLAEDGTILHENRVWDPMDCAGRTCPPRPRAVDFEESIQLFPGSAFYELSDSLSSHPPVRIDLRGHVQLLCMNAPCALDVCKPLLLDGGSSDVPARDSGPSAGADVGPEGGLPE